MAPAQDRDSFSEWLTTLPQAVLRWAGPVSSSRGSKSALGCLNPLLLLRIALVLIMVLLMPLFLMPLMLVRLVTTGRTSVRFSSTIDMTSGESARWGYGVLDPVAAPPIVQAGAAAIASRDPGFNPAALTGWAAAATELICQSLTSSDARPARTFMANGLFRSYQALLEIRTRAHVVCEGSWRPVGAVLVDAISTPLFDEVRVRLSCEGSCWERHEATGLTTRGSPDRRTWSEDLTFGRSADAVTPDGGGLPARRCPSCGAPLDLDNDGTCRYCHGIVTAGRHDWVLTGWRRDPW
jgi:hypothetical protein